MWRFNNPLPMPLYEGENGAGEGAGGVNPAGGEGGEKGKEESNKGDNIDQFANLWQDPVNDKQGKAQEPKDEPVAKDDGTKQFDAHLASLNFLDGVDVNEIANDLNQGNTESLTKMLSTQAQNVYKRALIDSNNLMDQKIGKAVDQAVQKSRTGAHGDMAVRVMEGTLPFTKDAAVQPIAKAVLGRLMSQGQDVDEAIGNVKKFFAHTANIASKELGKQRAPRSSPGSNFNGPADMSISDDGDDDPDWMSFLTE